MHKDQLKPHLAAADMQPKPALTDSLDDEGLENLARILGAYQHIQQAIEQLGVVGLDERQAQEHPRFLAMGGSNAAFELQLETGADRTHIDCVVLAPIGPVTESSILATKHKANALARGKGIAGLLQPVAINITPPIAVVERIHGSPLHEMPRGDIESITDAHWEALYKAAEQATRKGILLDPNADNILYNPNDGFTVIDYQPNTRPQIPEAAVREQNTDAVEQLHAAARSGLGR